MRLKQGLLLYLLLINLIAFGLCVHDKRAAQRGRWRVPERTLFGCAFALGAPGLYVGMRLFRHKTKKARFAIGILILCIVQIAILCLAFTVLTA